MTKWEPFLDNIDRAEPIGRSCHWYGHCWHWFRRGDTFRYAGLLDMPSQPHNEHDDQMVQLIAGCQRGLFLYICGLLFSRELAEDVLQETNLVLWQKRTEYRPDTNFYAWACQIAFYKVCQARDDSVARCRPLVNCFYSEWRRNCNRSSRSPARYKTTCRSASKPLPIATASCSNGVTNTTRQRSHWPTSWAKVSDR